MRTGSSTVPVGLAILLFLLCCVSPQLTSAQAISPDDIDRFSKLSREEQAAIAAALDEDNRSRDLPLSEPQLVDPRRVAQPELTSTETQEDRGIESLTSSVAGERARPDLRPFGYDLFAGEPTTFAPATDIPVPVDYVVGPGDTVEVQLFGNESAAYTLVVTREGLLNFPELGPVSVAGLPFNDMQALLQQRVQEQMIGVRASITMGKLRSIRVFVLGEAHRPGSYTVSSLTTMTNALFVSGGIQTIGSLRNIQLKRSGELVTTLDLYDLLLNGDTSGDRRLEPGDVIFIPPLGKTVGVDGEVRRPAIYELKGERTAQEAIALAGGILPTAYPRASQIERINENRVRTIVDVDLTTDDGMRAQILADDVIRIYSVLEKREDIVQVSGQVYRDGAYQWRPGMRLSDLLPSVDVLRPGADPNYLLIRRELPDQLAIDVLSANLSAALADPGSAADPPLKPRDRLFVFDINSDRSAIVGSVLDELRQQSRSIAPSRVVTISGRVRAPGQYPLEQGMRISDLIRAGGDLAEQAYTLGAELTRYRVVDGDIRATEVVAVDLESVLRGDASADMPLLEHDFLRINTIPGWASEWTVRIEGEVRFPGEYRIRRGETLSQLLERAGGLTESAFPEGSVFLRESLRELEQERIDSFVRRLEADLTTLALQQSDSQGDRDLDISRELLSQLRETRATGRLVIDIADISDTAAVAGVTGGLELRDGDRLLVPKFSQVVTVIGETQQNVSHLYQPGLDRDDYINMSGGLTRRADRRLIYIVRANGAVMAGNSSRWFGRSRSVDIRPGDTIVVPLKTDRIRPMTFWTNVTQILYQGAIAVAAVKTFDN